MFNRNDSHRGSTTGGLLAGAILAGAILLPDSALAGQAVAAGARHDDESTGLHVASPDWRDQVMYFAMIDRFDDGDPSNNDQGAGEYDPADGSRYSGGDLRGLVRRLDYIQGLGATALWITPPVANQWMNPGGTFSGYHGYWAEDFGRVDAHYGTLDDYRALSRALHRKGMYLVQDVVVNHVADYLACSEDAVDDHAHPGDPAAHCRVRADSTGRDAPTQAPFDRNDPRDPEQRRESIYHWTPPIADFTDRRQELDYQLADLDDLNTENPVVRRALRQAYGDWIREVGVDAFRVDTAFHVPADFFVDFLQNVDADAPGIARVAADTGRDAFLAFGEGFGTDKPFDDAQARKLDGYMRVPGGLPSMINFPLYGSLGDVFARGRPTTELGHRIASMMTLHADPHRMPSFIDNHDVDRFLAAGSEPALKQALLAMLTLPGIPVIYYGTEQSFDTQRPAMFAAGFGSGGRDRFDTNAPLYRYLQRAIALRRGDPVFSRGTPTVLADNPAGAGAIAWRLDADADAGAALVVLNSADHAVLLDHLDTGLPAGTALNGVFAIDGEPRDLIVDEGGRLTLVLPPRSGEVWKVETALLAITPTLPRKRGRGMSGERQSAASVPQLNPLPDIPIAGDFEVHGRALGIRELQLVIDGNLGAAQTVPVDADGRWQARVRADAMVDPAIEHRLVVRDPATGAVSDAQVFRVDLDWTLRADVADPRGDDSGPAGTYVYPADAGWRDNRPADIERVRVWTSGGALRVELTMRSLSTVWHPANGFDHVAFTAFLGLPGRDGGVRVMPQQHGDLPDGLRWHLRWRAHGWSNALFTTESASADNEGAPVTPVPTMAVDRATRTITATFPAASFGSVDSLDGAVLHLTTWDYDGGYRLLAQDAGPTVFGGGDGRHEPLWMDEITLIVPP